MTKLNNDLRELTIEELKEVSGSGLWDIMHNAAQNGSGMEKIANQAVWMDGHKH